MKGFIEVTVVTTGLDAPTVKQLLNVNQIDAVLSAENFTERDRAGLDVNPGANALIIAKAIADEPCEVEETYEQVKQLISEAM